MISVLLIDNNDSFTYNVVALLEDIVSDKSANDKFSIKICSVGHLKIKDAEEADRIIISPGPGLPSDYPILYDMMGRVAHKKSILGICLGHQLICNYYGAKLYNLGKVIHGQPRKLIIKKPDNYILKGIPDGTKAGLYHSWAVDPDTIPKELQVTALSEDGVIMAVSHKKLNVSGLQFHPESYITEYGSSFLYNFIYSK